MGRATSFGRKGLPWCGLLSAVAAVLIAGCGSTLVTSTSLPNGDNLNLQVSFDDDTVQLVAEGYGTVPTGTAGTLEVSGPDSWTCAGVFTAQTAGDDSGAQETGFTVGGYPEQGFYGPAGTYTFVLTLTSPKASVEASIDSDAGPQPPSTYPQTGCVQT